MSVRTLLKITNLASRKTYLVIRHSPPGMPYGFVRIIFILFQNFHGSSDNVFRPPSRYRSRVCPKPVTCHGHRKKCIVFRPRVTPGWGQMWGAPNPPPQPPALRTKKSICMRFRTPRNIFFFCVLRPQEDVFAEKKCSVTKNFHPLSYQCSHYK